MLLTLEGRASTVAESPELDLLRLKVAMLTQGVTLPSTESATRKGGAGPTEGRYFLLDDDVVVNAPVRHGDQAKRFHSLQLRESSNGRFRVQGFGRTEVEIRAVPLPRFYTLRLPNGTPMSYVALVHGIDCLATTIVQHCDYFDEGTQCRFCSLPISLELGHTILRKTPEQFLAVLQAAEKEGRVSHLTLTLGSPNRVDRGINDYVEFVAGLRQHTSIPIHAQIEPPTPLDQLEALREVGVDTVGIHIEMFEDNLRRRFCPGKFKHASFADYRNAWSRAVDLFGRGQVTTFVLLGLGEDPKKLHAGFRTCAEIGVIPVPVPCRPNPGSQLEHFLPKYIARLSQTVDIYLDCARLLHQAGLDPSAHRAGCLRCSGCTAITEAYKVIDAAG
jgi:radical SAM protein (TIGR04043 family)